MKIRTKLSLLVFFPILLLVGSTAIYLITQSEYKAAQKSLSLSQEITAQTNNLKTLLSQYLRYPYSRTAEQFLATTDNLENLIKPRSDEAQYGKAFSVMLEDIESLKGSFNLLVNVNAQSSSSPFSPLKDPTNPGALGLKENLYSQITLKSDDIHNSAQMIGEKNLIALEMAAQRAVFFLGATLLALSFVLVLIGVSIKRSISASLAVILEAVDKNTEEKTYTPIPLETKDELGEIATDFNKMLMTLRDFSSNAEAMEEEIRRRKKLNEELEIRGQALEHTARTDMLTGLYNRGYLYKAIEETIAEHARKKKRYSLLFIDLDNFKRINDLYGHQGGDALLLAISERLKRVFKNDALIARLGGDEFCVLRSGLEKSVDLAGSTQSLLETLSQPYMILGKKVQITISIGLADSSLLDDHPSADVFFEMADIALRQAKKTGKNRCCFFEGALGEQLKRRLKIENAFKRALAHEEFYLVFQPRFDMQTKKVIGAEVLARWHSKELGQIMPDEFIPIAEEFGFIQSLGFWVLEHTCQQLISWREKNLLPVRFPVGVNLSPLQVETANFADDLLALVNKYPGASSNLELELTESVFLGRSITLEETLQTLRDKHFKVAIDDFGTGYSSLGRLSKLPVDILKIDRSFVSRIGKSEADEVIIRSTVSLAKQLGMDVVAEGVEEEEQINFLVANDCLVAQGYYFSPPVPEKEFTALLEKSKGQSSKE